MSSKKTSMSDEIITEHKHAKPNPHIKPAHHTDNYADKKHPSSKKFVKTEDVIAEKGLANAARTKKANFASSKKYKKNQQEYLNEVNSHSQNNNINKKKKRNDGSFGF